MATTTTTDSSSSIALATVPGSEIINGNLTVNSQTTTVGLKVNTSGGKSIAKITEDTIEFSKAVKFLDNVQILDNILMGTETTYNTNYIGSPTIQVGNRFIVGDSAFKITAEDKAIIADTFTMTLKKLIIDNIVSDKETTELLNATDAKVTNELIANKIYADTLESNTLAIDTLSCLNIVAKTQMTAKDLIVSGSLKVQNDITIVGSGTTGTALTINGGQLVANYGIISNTANNYFQTLDITGDGTSGDTCFKVDKGVASYFEGDVTVADSNLILDNSKLYADNVMVASLSQTTRLASDSTSTDETSGIFLTTANNWETYKASMVEEVAVEDAAAEETFDPVEEVEGAIERNATNYNSIEKTVKSLTNPISYLLESNNSSLPKKFNINTGVYRIDSNGNALLKNVVAQNGRFSSLDAYKLNVNQLAVDKMVLTSVASNVVETDNLLKSTGIAEFDGSISIGNDSNDEGADVFIGKNSNINVAKGAEITLQSGASLTLKNGANFTMGTNTSVKMSGDIELDLAKLVFVDSTTGNKYRIGFKDICPNDGDGIVMTYEKVEETTTETTKDVVASTEKSASELSSKLASLGL